MPLPSGNADTITNALGPWNKGPGSNAAARAVIYQAALTGFFSYNEPSCRGVGVSSTNIGVGLATAGIGAIPVVGGALSKIVGIFGAHHAAAVKTEQATLCQAVPDANNFLRGIDAAIAQGQIDAPTATQAMEQGYQNWLAEVKAILQDTGGHCNAACVYEKCFRACIEKRKQDYALKATAVAAQSQGVFGGVVNAVSSVVSSVQQALSPTGSTILSTPAVVQAGLTPARQGTLAVFVIGGVILLGFSLFSNLFGGNK
jgi:hypothetical protein